MLVPITSFIFRMLVRAGEPCRCEVETLLLFSLGKDFKICILLSYWVASRPSKRAHVFLAHQMFVLLLLLIVVVWLDRYFLGEVFKVKSGSILLKLGLFTIQICYLPHLNSIILVIVLSRAWRTSCLCTSPLKSK